MLVQGEFDLNSVELYSGSFKDVLKQTMLSQEVMFRKQVLELHRLYGVQRVLTQKFGLKESDRCSFKKTEMEQTFFPCTNSARYDPMGKDTKVSSISMLEKRVGRNYKLQHRPLDLQLPADQFISLDGLDLEELNLSLNIGMGSIEKEGSKEIFLSKKSHILSVEVFDLEASIGGDAKNETSTNFDASRINTEFENSHSQISSENLSVKNEHFRSYNAGYLDLNEAQHEDSSCHSNDPFLSRYSTSSSSSGFKGVVGKVQQANCSSPIRVKEEKNNCSIESSTVEQDANLDFMDSGSRNEMRIEIQTTESKSKGKYASEIDTLCHEAPVGPMVNLSKDSSNCSDDESKNLEAVIELPVSIINNKNCVPPANSHNICYNTHKGLDVMKTASCTEQEHRSSDRNESDQDGESSEMKLLIQNAAESLVCMSLNDSACTHDESNHIKKDHVEQPQYSFDSFEILVLKETKNNEDEYSVSSKPSEVTDTENRDFGFKLRRGRRLKDFQKEILPGLSALSRHEICEDINILEAVLRSREYRKIRAKMSDGHKWCAPMRSKRSRHNNVRRRIIL